MRLLARQREFQAIKTLQTAYFCAMLNIMADQNPKDPPCSTSPVWRQSLYNRCTAQLSTYCRRIGLGMQRYNSLVEIVQTTHFCWGQRAIEEGKVINQANEVAHT